MAATDLGQVANGASTSAGTTRAITNTTGAIIPAGTTLVLSFVADNIASTTAPTWTVSTAGGSTWTQLLAPLGSGVTTTAGTGIWFGVWVVRTGADIASGAVVSTVTSNQSHVKRAGTAYGFRDLSTTARGTAGSNASTSGTASAATSGTALVSGDVVIGCVGTENGVIPTGDSDTLNGSWSSIAGIVATSGVSSANLAVGTQAKIVNATGAQTYNPVGANDEVVYVFSLIPAVIEAADSTLTVTATSTAASASTKPVDASNTVTATSTAAIVVDTAWNNAAAWVNTDAWPGPHTQTHSADSSLTVTAAGTAVGTTTKPVAANTLTATATQTSAASVVKPALASQTVTATLTAALGATTKPVLASATFTATGTGVAATTKPVLSSQTVTAAGTAVAATDKPVDAGNTITATLTASLTIAGVTTTHSADAALTVTETSTAAAAATKPALASLAATATSTASLAVVRTHTATSALTVTLTATAELEVVPLVLRFMPPTVTERLDVVGQRSLVRVPTVTGVSLLRVGGAWHQVRQPANWEIEQAEVVYLGGRLYEITLDEADALAEGGYGDYIIAPPGFPSFANHGAYGVGNYGQEVYG